MAMGTTPVLDDFNRSNVSPPGPLWASSYIQNATATPLGVNTNLLASTSATGNGYMSTDYGPDVEAYCTVTTKPASGQYIGIFCRVQAAGTSGWDGYALIWIVGATDTFSIRRYDNGVSTTLITPAATTLVAGQKIGFEVTGTGSTVTCRAYNTVGGVWTQVGGDATDTNAARVVAAGKIGFELSTTSIRVDDVGGGTIGGAADPVPPFLVMAPYAA